VAETVEADPGIGVDAAEPNPAQPLVTTGQLLTKLVFRRRCRLTRPQCQNAGDEDEVTLFGPNDKQQMLVERPQ